MMAVSIRTPTPSQLAVAQVLMACQPSEAIDPRVQALVNDLIGRVADKWSMLILEVLAEHQEMRFTQIGKAVIGISQKMLTQTLRQMERDGLLTRTVHAVVPPRVDYRLTDLGLTLGAAFCGVWVWAETNLRVVETARAAFDARPAPRFGDLSQNRNNGSLTVQASAAVSPGR